VLDQRLGHYRILEKIGAGGMGEVYRAHDETLDRDVALKVLPATRFTDPAARARLLREARTASQLNHPHICTIHEVGEAAGQAFIAMEFLDGQSLSARLAHGPLPYDEALRYGLHMADALGHAHERGIVHRDLKSANVVITRNGLAKVLDFGLAKRLTDEDLEGATRSQPSLTVPGALVGTLAYMAPEQLRGQPIDARSDVWALGVVLYEMATGIRPFQGNTPFELSSAILNGELPPLPVRMPMELRAVIGRSLEKEPARRYQNCGEVRAALEALHSGVVVPWAAWRYTLARRRWLVLVVTGVLLLATLAAVTLERLRTTTRGTPRIASLAVLPLENLSGDAAQDYLASGIHEALITDLAKLSGFRRVIARSSVKRFEKTTMTPRQIASELGVDALLTGTVLRSGNRVQITAHLITAEENQIWSERYDREFRDVLSLQNEIVSALTREIKLQLTPQEQARLKAPRPVNTEAFEAYLQGHFHWLKQTREDFDLAERYFQFALTKDPNFTLAYAGLGEVWLMRGDAGFQPPSETFPKATSFLAKAMEIDDSSAEVHVWLANLKSSIEWDWPAAEKEFKRAIELNPNLAEAHFFYADLLVVTKHNEEWRQEIQRARELDPLNDFNESFYGWQLNYQHYYDQAITIFQKLLPTGPNKAS